MSLATCICFCSNRHSSAVPLDLPTGCATSGCVRHPGSTGSFQHPPFSQEEDDHPSAFVKAKSDGASSRAPLLQSEISLRIPWALQFPHSPPGQTWHQLSLRHCPHQLVCSATYLQSLYQGGQRCSACTAGDYRSLPGQGNQHIWAWEETLYSSARAR